MVQDICFIHYGIGWKDGINMVLWTLVNELVRQRPDLKLGFLGGEIKEEILKKAVYQTIPELLPGKRPQNKKQLEEEALVIARKIAEATKGVKVIVIENPLIGDYHLAAMLGFSIYARQYKPSTTKLFFRIHDLFTDTPGYAEKLRKFFSPEEIKTIVQGEGVDGFLIINQLLKSRLVKEGIASEKIFYLPNGIDSVLFSQELSKPEKELIFQDLGLGKQSVEKTRILLYPVRVVPRKNIEEAILLTYFIRQITKANYTLVVAGKIDKGDVLSEGYYRILEELVDLAGLPVVFTKTAWPFERQYDKQGKVEKFSIGDLYQSAQAIVMTSLREGFGYPFLECWFVKKMIIGRRIESVLGDFEKSGLKFSWLYDNFLIEPTKSAVPEKEASFDRAKKVIKIFKEAKLKEQILELNRAIIMEQLSMLEDKDKCQRIIELNLKTAKEVYQISVIARRFLKIIGLA